MPFTVETFWREHRYLHWLIANCISGLREAMLGLDSAAYLHSYTTQSNLGQTASQKSLLDSPQTFVWHSVLVSQNVKNVKFDNV